MHDARIGRTALIVSLCLSPLALAADWPTYQHDNARSGVAGEALSAPLHERWVHEAAHAPDPAWPPPAKQDFWHDLTKLVPRVIYDRAFHPVIVGDTLYFGSSADDAVYALDAGTGEPRWVFAGAEGPVRLAPTVTGGRAYFGSDDGCVYCVRADDGELVWKLACREHPAIGRERQFGAALAWPSGHRETGGAGGNGHRHLREVLAHERDREGQASLIGPPHPSTDVVALFGDHSAGSFVQSARQLGRDRETAGERRGSGLRHPLPGR